MSPVPMSPEKEQVYDFWNRASCGEDLYLPGDRLGDYDQQAQKRYELEPYIRDFANFADGRGKRVLEIGVGLGADHEQWARAGADLYGVDLTDRAIGHTTKRLEQLAKLKSNLRVGDAENLPFDDAFFDIVYSWGVIHCSPETPKAVSEIWRVLKPGASARIMIYHKYSFVGYMLWLRYALMRGKPGISLQEIYPEYLESPGTKAYSVDEARAMFSQFKDVQISTILCHGDLLSSPAGQRHRGLALSAARMFWPRPIIRRFFPTHGLFMLIEGRK